MGRPYESGSAATTVDFASLGLNAPLTATLEALG